MAEAAFDRVATPHRKQRRGAGKHYTCQMHGVWGAQEGEVKVARIDLVPMAAVKLAAANQGRCALQY